MRLIDKAKCPECRSTRTEEHGTNPGDFNWWLCRECGYNWPTPTVEGAVEEVEGAVEQQLKECGR